MAIAVDEIDAGSVLEMKLLKRIFGALVVLNLLLVFAAQVVKRMVPSYGDPESEVFSVVAALDGSEFASRAEDLNGGSVTAFLGGAVVDLTGATVAPEARLELRAVLGGIDVVVPATWRLITTASGFAGGVDGGEEAADLATDAPVLEIDAQAFFGGISIRMEDTVVSA